MLKQKLTGNRRYRQHNRWFGKSLIVLQVEVYQEANEFGEYIISLEKTFWRDATAEDLLNQHDKS